MERNKKESLVKLFAGNLPNLKLFKLLFFGALLFITFGFQKKTVIIPSNIIKGSTAKFSSPPEIEVMTSQQLFVTDLVKVNKNKVNVKSKLMDAFRAIRYNTDSTKDDTGWLLVDTARRFTAGSYPLDHENYDELDSLISKVVNMKATSSNKKTKDHD
ncbi:hypothetical protein [Pedobacter sp. MC2016-24]|uniref:hypothetical protein n=1 Tax=Pedobacter sp. MC2016-24 TaxID=2780090 RepID=UPI00187EEF1C|nr:hypothetical protein [Pedobacter sp. MC2016-24]MBE9601955.1 hypothetical protein [Pedobacter sp. MC2016-24]